jgi:predicted cupin superfamily sugar epimerase
VPIPDSATSRLIQALDLQPHPEGGYFRETYRSPERILRPDNRERNASTAIYYLLQSSDYSAWHRIRSDELWHFHAGTPLDVHVLGDNGSVVTHRVGNPLVHAGAVFQAVVPANHWFAAERVQDIGNEDFALLGCTVAPGFEFSEFELGHTAALLATYPNHAALIRRLAPKSA